MKNKLFLVLYIIIAFVLLCTNVYATVTTDLTLTADKTTVKSGEDVIISINLKNISTPIASVKGYIDIDENVLDPISEDMIVKNSDGKVEITSEGIVTNTLSYSYNPPEPVDTDIIFNPDSSATEGHDLYFTEDFNNTGISSDTVILKLKFTVKSTVSDGELDKAISVVDLIAESTKLENGSASTDKSDKLSADISITVDNVDHEKEEEEKKKAEEEAKKKAEEEAKKKAEEEARKAEEEKKKAEEAAKKKAEEEAKKKAEEAKKANQNKNNTNTNKNNTNKIITNTNINKDNTVSGTRIPATGARSFIIPVVVLCILGFVSYKKYMDYKDF